MSDARGQASDPETIQQRLAEFRAHAPNHGECPVRGIMDRIGSKWSVLLIVVLAERPHRFGELRRAVADISQHMLTQTLRELRQDGLVSRHVHDTTPPTVEYRLTPLGQTLLDPLSALLRWAEDHAASISGAREAFARAESAEARA